MYLAASASAEFFADILLCPFEACKVRIQTQPGWARTLREGMPKLHAEEGIAGFVVKSSLAEFVVSPEIIRVTCNVVIWA